MDKSDNDKPCVLTVLVYMSCVALMKLSRASWWRSVLCADTKSSHFLSVHFLSHGARFFHSRSLSLTGSVLDFAAPPKNTEQLQMFLFVPKLLFRCSVHFPDSQIRS